MLEIADLACAADPRRQNSGDVVQLVRTPACHVGGRGFEPRRPRQIFFRTLSEETRPWRMRYLGFSLFREAYPADKL